MSSAPLPPLAAIRCFEAAARQGSFTRAAQELGMTQAAMSYQIRILEERLGAPLFLRGPRGVALTDLGRRLSPAILDAFAQMRVAFDDVRDTGEGLLAISVLSTFAANWLVPRLGEFQFAHPQIAVRLDTSQHYVDFAREPFDCAIRSGRGGFPGLVAHRLMGIAYTPMMSPRLLGGSAMVRGAADLLGFPLIDPGDRWWVDWFTAAGVPDIDLSHRTEMQIQTQHLAGRAAVAGHGVAILTPAFFADELAAGLLVQPLPFVREGEDSYWLVYPDARRRSPKIRAFRDWLLEKFPAAT